MKLPNLRSSDLMVSRITRQELPALTAFCVTCSAFFELVEGKPGSHAVASAGHNGLEILSDGPG